LLFGVYALISLKGRCEFRNIHERIYWRCCSIGRPNKRKKQLRQSITKSMIPSSNIKNFMFSMFHFWERWLGRTFFFCLSLNVCCDWYCCVV
jgi:hypothetical protein